MSARTWFTADLHLGHANIIRHCARPFADAAEMDASLIANWNATVGPRDDIYVVGDFAFRGTKSPGDYLRRLAGRKHLVVGNHDSRECLADPGWASVSHLAELKVDGGRIVLCHYALRVWNRSYHGALHLFGHSHGQLRGDRQSLDVGVDCWDFRPIGLPEIRERLLTLPERGGAGGVS